MKKSVTHIVLARVIGFFVFLLLLAIANALTGSIQNDIYANIVTFFNVNILLFLALMVIGLINDIFWSFSFPFNILGPFSAALLSIFIVTFLYRLWLFLNSYINSNVNIPIGLLYVIVPIIVFFAGCITVIFRAAIPPYVEKVHQTKKRKKQHLEWDEVGEEFKLALYNLGKAFNRVFDKKRKR
ncbi:MAG: hypothetical protein V1837_05085 [Candidatus Woesearchaeota archaeon]